MFMKFGCEFGMFFPQDECSSECFSRRMIRGLVKRFSPGIPDSFQCFKLMCVLLRRITPEPPWSCLNPPSPSIHAVIRVIGGCGVSEEVHTENHRENPTNQPLAPSPSTRCVPHELPSGFKTLPPSGHYWCKIMQTDANALESAYVDRSLAFLFGLYTTQTCGWWLTAERIPPMIISWDLTFWANLRIPKNGLLSDW